MLLARLTGRPPVVIREFMNEMVAAGYLAAPADPVPDLIPPAEIENLFG